MSQIFDIDSTRKQQIIVEYITPSGSGFAVNPQGEQVFMNARLVSAMKVEAGDTYEAFLLPNYPDKKEMIPWRAMRVEPTEIDLGLGHVSGDKNPNRIIEYMQAHDDGIAWTITELSEDLEMPLDEVKDILDEHSKSFMKVDAYILLPAYK
tara:strand:- start:968 stop:1420 length:453 start_codon:yes stop_codon:yes gene_type:complete